MSIHLKTQNEFASIQFYGITQDPETHSYMMVLEYAEEGNLREYLKTNFNKWTGGNDKIDKLIQDASTKCELSS